jgi:predicted AlkP superfamily phosphohydrolase/phosphomutase
MLFYELERFTEGFLFIVFDTPDRVQHMLWRFLDTGHPGYDPEMARESASHIEQHYVRCDQMLERVLERIDENTLLVVLSDHGFNSFRRAFDTNTWLWENKLLSFKDEKKPERAAEGAAHAVDWSRTYAYAMGLGGIYLNLKGRERAGIVEEGGDADRVRRAVQEGLSQCRDVKDGARVIASVSRREAMYNGAYAKNAPDLLVNFHPGYRVSWESAVGGVSESLIQNNTRKWSGDHIMNPDAVPGILFMNRPGRDQPANIVDLAPTILEFLGVVKGDAMEGNSLLAS